MIGLPPPGASIWPSSNRPIEYLLSLSHYPIVDIRTVLLVSESVSIICNISLFTHIYTCINIETPVALSSFFLLYYHPFSSFVIFMHVFVVRILIFYFGEISIILHGQFKTFFVIRTSGNVIKHVLLLRFKMFSNFNYRNNAFMLFSSVIEIYSIKST